MHALIKFSLEKVFTIFICSIRVFFFFLERSDLKPLSVCVVILENYCCQVLRVGCVSMLVTMFNRTPKDSVQDDQIGSL